LRLCGLAPGTEGQRRQRTTGERREAPPGDPAGSRSSCHRRSSCSVALAAVGFGRRADTSDPLGEIMRKFFPSAVLVAFLSLVPVAAQAESFVVSGSPHRFVSLIFDYEGDFFLLSGSGFQFHHPGSWATFVPRTFASSCTFCAPGDVVNPSFTTPGAPGTEVPILEAGLGRAMIGGAIYEGVTYTGWLDVDAEPFVFPELETDFFAVQVPFTLSGFLRGFSGGSQIFAGSLTGSGIASLPYFPSRGVYEWEERRLNYVFGEAPAAATPEPATMLLLGTGLAGLIASRRRISPRR
jgi:hypothetical protein